MYSGYDELEFDEQSKRYISWTEEYFKLKQQVTGAAFNSVSASATGEYTIIHMIGMIHRLIVMYYSEVPGNIELSRQMRQFLDYAVPELYHAAALNDFFTVPNELFGLFLNIGEHFLSESNRHLLVQAGSQMNLRTVGPDHDAEEAQELGLPTDVYQKMLYELDAMIRQ